MLLIQLWFTPCPNLSCFVPIEHELQNIIAQNTWVDFLCESQQKLHFIYLFCNVFGNFWFLRISIIALSYKDSSILQNCFRTILNTLANSIRNYAFAS